MGSVEQWVPNAIQAVTAIGQLYLGIADHRLKQAEAWGRTVEELTELEPEELRRAIEATPAAAELIERAFEAAIRTGSEEKRYILARVAAAALSGDTTPEKIDRLQFLARPVIALDPPHITLLVVIGQVATDELSPDKIPNPVERSTLAAEWPGGWELLDPAIAALVREGLVTERLGRDQPLVDQPATCELLPFGKAFLDYLLIDAGGWPPTTTRD
jgi:hypothetical protein